MWAVCPTFYMYVGCTRLYLVRYLPMLELIFSPEPWVTDPMVCPVFWFFDIVVTSWLLVPSFIPRLADTKEICPPHFCSQVILVYYFMEVIKDYDFIVCSFIEGIMTSSIIKWPLLWRGTTTWDITFYFWVNIDRIISRLLFVELSYHFTMYCVVLSVSSSCSWRLFFK